MYNELCLSNFVVIKDDKREIILVAAGVWIWDGLWEPHAGQLNWEKTSTSLFHSQVTSCFINVSIFLLFSSLLQLQLFSLIDVKNGSPFLYCINMGPTIIRIIIVGDLCKGIQGWRLLRLFENANRTWFPSHIISILL